MKSNAISHEQAVQKIQSIVKEKGSQLEASKFLDISPTYIGEILKGTKKISDNVARKLGYRRVIGFEKIQE